MQKAQPLICEARIFTSYNQTLLKAAGSKRHFQRHHRLHDSRNGLEGFSNAWGHGVLHELMRADPSSKPHRSAQLRPERLRFH